MKTKSIILCALLLLLMPAAFAKTQKERPLHPCEGNGSQAEATGCARREYEAADAELNKVYGRLAAALDAEDKALLKASELAWIKYRDSTCEFESSQYKGGTMRPMIESFCLTRVTKARAAELNKTYGRLAAVLNADEKALLKESELNWIKYRDSNCVFESSQYAGGTMRPMIENFCLARVTKARTAELKEQYEQRK